MAEAAELLERVPKKLELWPHQKECLRRCRAFIKNQTVGAKRDFFVQMATGTGKSLIMADLSADLRPSGKACVIVPKLDLMEQMAALLENMLPSTHISRVGTGWRVNLAADIFVCVRNSGWQLANCSFDLLLLDEAHHYEPSNSNVTSYDSYGGPHLRQVLALKGDRRIFFSATLVRNSPDFDFSLRPAIEAGVIQDYSIIVPLVSEGDPCPSLVEIIQDLPLSRKVLAFCNTVGEAKRFTKLLISAGVAADHYNGETKQSQRQEVLRNFALRESNGGIRVLVTVDVLSEGVDLPMADTCLFVAPRHGIRFRQCVGRVLRRESKKLDAVVIAPPIIQFTNGTLTEDVELSRLLEELATVDPLFKKSLGEGHGGQSQSLAIKAAGLPGDLEPERVIEKAAELLGFHVLPSVLKGIQPRWLWWYKQLTHFKAEKKHVVVPTSHKTVNGFALGSWVKNQRVAKAKGKLASERVTQLDKLGFVWDPLDEIWASAFLQLQQCKVEHGDVLVPSQFKTADGFALGSWVGKQRIAKAKDKLASERVTQLDKLGFVWDPLDEIWASAFLQLQQYKVEHGDVLVPQQYKTADDFALGSWVGTQRIAKAKDKLAAGRVAQLDKLGFVWDPLDEIWASAFLQLQQYKVEYGDILVPQQYKTADGFALGRWVGTQRIAKAKDKLAAGRVAQLDKLGFVWDPLDEIWASAFLQLQQYKVEHGDVFVPWQFKTADGFALGNWVGRQRVEKTKDKLAAGRVAQLDKLGFVWDSLDEIWASAFLQLQQYKVEYGDILVPWQFKTADGFALGRWVGKQRIAKAKDKLASERVTQLDKLGFVWDPLDEIWASAFLQLQQYKVEHGDVLVPQQYKTADDFALGHWVGRQRVEKAKDKLAAGRVAQLDKLGFVWDSLDEIWASAFLQLQEYKVEHGDVLVPQQYKTADGFALGSWVGTQRIAKAKDKLAAGRVAQLDKLGFVWDPLDEIWASAFLQLQQYKVEHGDVLVPSQFKTADGFALGSWVKNQRFAKAKGKLASERVTQLDKLGFVWDPLDEIWASAFLQLQQYKVEYGDILVPWQFKTADGFALGRWVGKQRIAKAKDKLASERVTQLDKLGFVWDPLDEIWASAFLQLQQYKVEHGDVLVPWQFKSDGFALGHWVGRQRVEKAKDKLAAGRVAQLDKLGFVWDPLDEIWASAFLQLQEYKVEHGDVLVPQQYKTADGFALGNWVGRQRVAKAKDKLAAGRVAQLDKLGFVWALKRGQGSICQ